MRIHRVYTCVILAWLTCFTQAGYATADRSPRQDISLDASWKSIALETTAPTDNNFARVDFDDSAWTSVEVPHNWDQYQGYRRIRHGNLHGTAWYRRTFRLAPAAGKQRYFLWFEGVGSYATVWVNGHQVGTHTGGRTTFTLDITQAVRFDRPNVLAVRADHPAHIRDLPWVCGGCSDEIGFSEGSQPMGIFRPVHLIITHEVRIEPFGVHIWNDNTISRQQAQLHSETEVKNYGGQDREIRLIQRLLDHQGRAVAWQQSQALLQPGQTFVFRPGLLNVTEPNLWSPDHPYLYQVQSQILEHGTLLDETLTPYGIRWISWPQTRKDGSKQFLVNGQPVFINGVCEYEHLFGDSHAFSAAQIHARVQQIEAAGFNAFRDAHQPHNLRYQRYFEQDGLLWWPQMSAHIWFDTPAFKRNFKTLLRDWVKERRNNPSLILWGLQNESHLPRDFARQCVQIIREMDPTASSQRLITTCNGGEGTDWDVPQNWSGTYGGDPTRYTQEIQKQLLVGEYGAWRSIDLHTEGPFVQNGPLSENRMTQLLEMKMRLAESVRNQCCGHFLWLFSSHDNPGRIQNGEGLRDIDRIGPVNYKGLLTSWGEPVDAYYMARSHHVPADKGPMVTIVSHTWPNRWATPEVKDRVTVYSNCQAVELFNDVGHDSLGRQTRPPQNTPWVWTDPNIQYNVLQAIGYVGGQAVARDTIVLNSLPQPPHFSALFADAQPLTRGQPGYHYLYRVNCGGPAWTDEVGQRWQADRWQTSPATWGSLSWTDHFDHLPAFYGSQRRTFDPIRGTKDWKLFQTFRFGRNQLAFNFPVPDGEYRVELYFIEPWYGTGGGLNCRGWRCFDVAVNDQVVLPHLDLWQEAGHDRAVKKVVNVQVRGGTLSVHFPRVVSGQAVISAIAIATRDQTVTPAPPSASVIQNLHATDGTTKSWLDWGDLQYQDQPWRFRQLPSNLFAADWIKTRSVEKTGLSFQVRQKADVFIALSDTISSAPAWLNGFNRSSLTLQTDNPHHPDYTLYSKRVSPGHTVTLGTCTPMFNVFVVPVYTLAPPADQRPKTMLRTPQATLNGDSIMQRQVKGRAFMEMRSQGPCQIQWPWRVGLAGTYNLTVKFNNPTDHGVPLHLRLETHEGQLIEEQPLTCRPTQGKWRNVTTTTNTDINAGVYRITLSLSQAQGLKIQRLEIQ